MAAKRAYPSVSDPRVLRPDPFDSRFFLFGGWKGDRGLLACLLVCGRAEDGERGLGWVRNRVSLKTGEMTRMEQALAELFLGEARWQSVESKKLDGLDQTVGRQGAGTLRARAVV